MTKETTSSTVASPSNNNNSLGIVSLVLGLVSLTGPGLLLGIPAIILGAIALKRKQGERGLSITGIVTGAVSTFFSLVIIAFVAFLVFWSAAYPDTNRDARQPTPQEQHNRFDSSST